MRKSFMYIAMAAFALSSCSKNEVSENPTTGFGDPNKISFNTSTGTTRATESNLTSVEGGFNVLGFKNGESSPFIAGKDNEGTYKYTSATSTWGWVGTSYNWPTDQAKYPITFYAEYPKVADMSANTDLNKAITMDLGMADQEDLLVARTEVADRPANGFAPLQFKHILSNIAFKIETKEGYKVHIQSVRVVNTATSGRTFDYATMAYGTEPTPYTNLATTDGTYKETEGFYFRKGNTPWSFTGAAGALVGTVEPETNATDIMMQMPQMTIPSYWVESNTTDGLGKFKEDAKAWKDANGSLEDWYTGTVGGTPAGMSGSDGWKGARIEVIYRIYDETNSKSVIGRQKDEEYKDADGTTNITADKDLFIRVGYPLDLSELKVNSVSKGWEMNKRYTYTIQLGTAKATNGILLDPDYKGIDGETSDTPKKPVENPKVDPGNPTTPGTINFTVGVDEWVDNNTNVGIN